mmetsp:Transcript_131923/g.329014  ORF Transcript_131923/g.329014 Transcript_131923/m.329014 type:complete len:82 (-) Transcript_131923:1264-1509(-)
MGACRAEPVLRTNRDVKLVEDKSHSRRTFSAAGTVGASATPQSIPRLRRASAFVPSWVSFASSLRLAGIGCSTKHKFGFVS